MNKHDHDGGLDRNRRIYETKYSAKNYARKGDDDVFGKLAATKLSTLRAATKPGDRVLDLCCGSGEALRPLAADGIAVVGVDFSGPILDELRDLFAADGHDPEQLDLRRGDARDIPADDGAFDVVCCFSALYTIPNPERVLAEIARVLKPGGRAILDLGMRRSLNSLEARRVSTGVSTHELRPGPALRRLADLGLAAVSDRAFQLFPCWGGATPRAAQVLNPLLARRFGASVAGDPAATLDEAVASSPLLRPFAFRRLIVVERTTPESARAILAVRRAAERAASIAAFGACSAAGRDKRAAAALAAERGFVAEAASLYLAALCVDHGDTEAAIGLADLFDGAEERAATERWKRIARRARARAASAIAVPQSAAAATGAAKLSSASSGTEKTLATPKPKSAPEGVASRSPRTPRVSVVLPVYNDAARLPRAVASVLEQSFTDFELIVVDDGSTDGSAAALAEIRDPRLRIVRQENRRLPGALDRGFAAACGELLTWTSSDNLCAPGWLDALVAALDRNPDCGLAVGGFAWIDDADRILRVTRDQDVSTAAFLTRNPGNAAFLYRASLAAAIGGYDAALEGAEDWDYWVRLAERAPVVRVDAVLYYYREHGDSMTATMPQKIADASRAVVTKAIARAGGGLDVATLYPEIAGCTDRDAAETDAAFDLGVRMLKSPWCDPRTAARCFEAVLDRAPDSGMAAANLALALGRAGEFAEALALAERLNGDAHPNARLITTRIRTAAKTKNGDVLLHVPPFLLNPETNELRKRIASSCRTHDGSSTAESPIGGGDAERSAGRTAGERPLRVSSGENGGLTFVVISAGTRPASLAAVVRAVRAQRAPGAEILVVGAGGAPEGARFIPAEDDARAGRLGAMRNRGFAAARGAHVVVLDDDVLLAPDWYARFRETLGSSPEFHVLTSEVRTPDGGRYWDHATHGGPRGHLILEAHESDDHLYPTGGGGFVVARRVFEEVRYDESRGYYEGEDLDFAMRLRTAGFKITHASALCVWHADPTYTTVGRRTVRRKNGRGAAAVCGPYKDADAETILKAAADEQVLQREAEAADLLRFGSERYPADGRFARRLATMERAAGGRLSDVRFHVEGDPAFLALAQEVGHPAAPAFSAAAHQA